MTDFFAELKRRHIYRVGAAYVVAAWALTQLVEILAQVFTLPLWIAQTAIVLLALGFPAALLVAWTIESKPHRAIAAVVKSKPTVLDWALFGAVAGVLLLMAYQQFASPPQQAGVDAARAAAASPSATISVAVLPFTNLSSDPEQEFFSDGMTEEITAALAKVPDLRVVARTSAFEFKGQNRNIQSIGEQLKATHLIEGSVRKAGDRVRITVQLIKADDGIHLWSENYERELVDVFAIQEDIARTVTASFNMSLNLKPGENLVNNRDIDQESYQQYLLAKALERARGFENLNTAVALLEQVVVRNPNYAPAWALLTRVLNNVPNWSPPLLTGMGSADELRRVVEAATAKAVPAARKAIELDPNLPDAYVAVAGLEMRSGHFLVAEELYSKALALDPHHAEALESYSSLLVNVGRVKDALIMGQQAHALEPFVPISKRNLALAHWVNGNDEVALALFKEANVNRNTNIAMVYAGAGRFSEAADAISSDQSGFYTPAMIEEAVRLIRMAPGPVTLPDAPVQLGFLDFVYAYVGAPELFLDYFDRNVEAGWMVNAQTRRLWHPSLTHVRKTERFRTLMRKAGMVEYWRAKGWPEFCRPTTGDDFGCS